MNILADALAWLFSPERLTGSHPLLARVGEHLGYTAVALLISALIAIPLGYLIGHTGRGRGLAVLLSGAARALPSLGLLTILALLLGLAQAPLAATIVFVILGVPSILAGAYSGLEAIDRSTIDAARAVGMTEWQILWRVEAPLGLPLLVGGLRAAALQIVATAVLAAYVNLGGLGIYIQRGIQLQQPAELYGGALAIVVLALLVDGVFALAQRTVRPAGLSTGRTPKRLRAPASAAAPGS